MGTVVTFNYPLWVSRYPEFGYIPQAQAQLYFNEASIYHRNDGFGPVEDATSQLTFLNMLTAHIAFLNAQAQNGQPASTIVGRIASAGEGSVNVSADMGTTSEQEAWFNQTKYGAAYWAATRPYRTMRWIRRRNRRVFDPYRIVY